MAVFIVVLNIKIEYFRKNHNKNTNQLPKSEVFHPYFKLKDAFMKFGLKII